MKRPFLIIGPEMDGRDRWYIGTGNTTWRVWSMPRWLSFGRYWSTVKL